jgi:hypothetical protein
MEAANDSDLAAHLGLTIEPYLADEGADRARILRGDRVLADVLAGEVHSWLAANGAQLRHQAATQSP